MPENKRISVKKNDLKAPRFRKTDYVYPVVNKDLHHRWVKETGNNLSFKEFRAIWDKIAEIIRNQAVINTHGVRLPFFNGDVVNNYIQVLNRHINTKASQELGYKIYQLDWHSGKKPGKIVWAVRHARKQNRWVNLYAFQPCRMFQKEASEGFFKHPEIYRYARTNNYVATVQQERK